MWKMLRLIDGSLKREKMKGLVIIGEWKQCDCCCTDGISPMEMSIILSFKTTGHFEFSWTGKQVKLRIKSLALIDLLIQLGKKLFPKKLNFFFFLIFSAFLLTLHFLLSLSLVSLKIVTLCHQNAPSVFLIAVTLLWYVVSSSRHFLFKLLCEESADGTELELLSGTHYPHHRLENMSSVSVIVFLFFIFSFNASFTPLGFTSPFEFFLSSSQFPCCHSPDSESV